MKRPSALLFAACVALMGCDDGRGRAPMPRDAAGDNFDAGRDGSLDTGLRDVGTRDAGTRDTSAVDMGVDAPGSALDPSLDTAGASGDTCTTPGSLGECPTLEVCRFFDSASGRCETCDGCGNLGSSCADGRDCDILFACYTGRCANICPLGTSFCGPPDDCLDVGHPTHGVCRP